MKLPLEGVRIVDFTRLVAGPLGTRIMGELGAQVIKVEGLSRYDTFRINRGGRALPGVTGKPYNTQPIFNNMNAGKLGLTLEMSGPKATQVIKRLVRVSDIVIDNYSPRVMKNFGLSYEELVEVRPDVIAVSEPGFGSTGPEKDYVSYAPTLEMVTGMASLTGYDPEGEPYRTGGLAVPDVLGGLYGAAAMLTALQYRRRTGQGQFVDLGQVEATANTVAEGIMEYAINGRVPPRQANHHTSMAPHNTYPCKGDDKWVSIAVGSDAEWQSLCKAMGNPALARDPRFADTLGRWKRQGELDPLITEWTKQREHYEVTHLLQKAGVPAGPVLGVTELFNEPHLRARGFFQPLTHPDTGTHDFVPIPYHMSETPLKVPRHAPRYAEHNDYVFKELLGMTEPELQELVEMGIVGTEPRPGA